MSEKAKVVNRVSIICIAVNILLSIGKFIVGTIGHSSAIITDAMNSTSDVISTIIIIIGNKVADKDADDEHPYGHEKFECIFMLLFVVLLVYASIEMLKDGVSTVYFGLKDPLVAGAVVMPGVITIWISVITIIVKFVMARVTFFYAKKVKSMSLMADGKNHEIDAVTSVLIVIALFFAVRGVWWADAAASIMGCIFLFKLAFELLLDAVNGLVDKSAGDMVDNQAVTVAENVDGVIKVDRLRSRQFGSRIYIDMEISLDGSLSLRDAHDIAEKVHHEVQKGVEDCKHCMVHVNPSEPDK